MNGLTKKTCFGASFSMIKGTYNILFCRVKKEILCTRKSSNHPLPPASLSGKR